MGPETGFFTKRLIAVRRFGKKPGFFSLSEQALPYKLAPVLSINQNTKKSPARRQGISFNYLETRVQSYPNFPAVEAITKAA